MRFRPANIRLINRRSKLPRLLLALPSKNGKSNSKNNNKNPTDAKVLTGSLHIRALWLLPTTAATPASPASSSGARCA
jgi:hypothetical protein